MKLVKLLILIFLFFQNIQTKVYEIEEIFSILDDLYIDKYDLEIIIDCFISIFREVYAYYEVAKNPPQPSFDNHYHETVNIEESLKNIKSESPPMYKFYQKLKLLFDNLGDQHLNILNEESILGNIYFTDPLKLSIKSYEDKPRIFAEIQVKEEDYKHFRNYEEIFNIIKRNSNIPIKTINGKDPFDFITYFGGNYEKVKSPQGTFRYKYFWHNNEQSFMEFPLSKGDFINFTVVYENGDSIITDYMIYSDQDYNKNDFEKEIKLFVNKIKEKYKTSKNLNKKLVLNDFFISRNEKIYRKIHKNRNLQKEKRKINFINSDIKWDYNYDSNIACRVDKNKKINLYVLTNFGIDGSFDYSDTVEDCAFLFDKNNYPIVVVNVFNVGGLVYNSQFLMELLSPNTELHIYGTFRKTDIFKNNNIIREYISSVSNSKDCEPFDYSSLMKTKKTIDYGNDVSDTLLGPIIFNGRGFVSEINKLRDELKRPRKPTDILIYTDGFSYSATSLLLKYLQYYGGAITAGYFCNPNFENIPFDSSLSPSAIFTPDMLYYLEPKGYKTLSNDYDYELIIPAIQSFYNTKNFSRPLEYEVTPVDEKVNIFFDKVYEEKDTIDPSDFDVFIDNSLPIFEKYKTRCNPNNKKLLLITDECDANFEKHIHGGYECGDDGFWTKNCVASYCDIGYIFDHETKKCIENVCAPEDVLKLFIIVIVVLIVFIIIVFLFIKIGIKIIRKNRMKRIELNSQNRVNLGVTQNNRTSTEENLIN